MNAILTPEVTNALMLFGAALAAVLAPKLFTMLKNKALGTKTMADDDFLSAIEGIVEGKLADLSTKAKSKITK